MRCAPPLGLGNNKQGFSRHFHHLRSVCNSGSVRDTYEEIKAQLGIDFVPNLYRVMALKPGYLEANWSKVKAVMVEPGKLDPLPGSESISIVRVRARSVPRNNAICSWNRRTFCRNTRR